MYCRWQAGGSVDGRRVWVEMMVLCGRTGVNVNNVYIPACRDMHFKGIHYIFYLYYYFTCIIIFYLYQC